VSHLSIIKAHAFGNDFLLVTIDRAASWADPAAVARRLCDRHRGIGADGLMVLTPTSDGADTGCSMPTDRSPVSEMGDAPPPECPRRSSGQAPGGDQHRRRSQAARATGTARPSVDVPS
jgi:hypothetical protein